MPGATALQHTGERRLHSLDGLRAISIVMVLLGHLGGTRNFAAPETVNRFGYFAYLGVLVFFVISGFLITSLLINEYRQSGRVSLKLFYARRALRILPASMTYLGVVAALSAAGIIVLHHHDLLFGFLYLTNYHLNGTWYIGHLWSLSVEEQFYLLWPFCFAAVGPKAGMKVAAAVMIVGPIARAATWIFLRSTPYYQLALFPTVADSLAAGCLLAGMRDWLETQRWYLALFQARFSIPMLAAVLVTNWYLPHAVAVVFGKTLINVVVAILIHRSVYCWRDPAGRVLNWKPLASLGVLSYSLYLWQEPFLNRYSNSWITAFPQNLLLAFGTALLSYTLLEKPLLRLRHRLRAASPAPQPERVRVGGGPEVSMEAAGGD